MGLAMVFNIELELNAILLKKNIPEKSVLAIPTCEY